MLRIGIICAVCIRDGGGLSKIFRGSLSDGRGGRTGLGISSTGGDVGRCGSSGACNGGPNLMPFDVVLGSFAGTGMSGTVDLDVGGEYFLRTSGGVVNGEVGRA